MAGRRVAVLIVALAIMGSLFPQFFKSIFIQIAGISPLFQHLLLNNSPVKVKLFTKEELALYNGEAGSPGLYLSILGRVYDVKKGKKHYGPGGGYHGFAGRDGSAAFASGDFSNSGLARNVLTLTDSEIKTVWDWIALYDKQYKYKGKLIGQFYDDTGEPTHDYQSVVEMVKKAEEDSESKKADMLKFPPCNMEWSADTGSRVWCSTRSGGVERDWVGVPRKYYEPGAKSYRCACVPLSTLSQSRSIGMIEEYDSCRPQAESCFIKTGT